jgi:Phage integrase, N-terminal SAM-like domain
VPGCTRSIPGTCDRGPRRAGGETGRTNLSGSTCSASLSSPTCFAVVVLVAWRAWPSPFAAAAASACRTTYNNRAASLRCICVWRAIPVSSCCTRRPKTTGRSAFDVEAAAGTASLEFHHPIRRSRQLGQLASEVIGSNATLEDFLVEWWDTYAATYLRPNTLATYTTLLDKWIVPYLGRKRLREITRETVDNYAAHEGSPRGGSTGNPVVLRTRSHCKSAASPYSGAPGKDVRGCTPGVPLWRRHPFAARGVSTDSARRPARA